MRRYNLIQSIIFILVVISVQACGFAQQATQEASTPTATGTLTSTVTPSPTMTPTNTPRPSKTPNATQTQNYDDIFSQVQRFADDGLIPNTYGKYRVMNDFNNSVAQIGLLQYWYFYDKVKYFVIKAHVEWGSAIDTLDTSGCGIVFALQEKKDKSNDYYGVIIDKSRIYFTTIESGYYYNVKKTRGTGVLNFGNPASADLTLLVYDYKAYVYVDDEFIGEYTLAKSKDLRGYFGYGIISGTNRSYGTRCQITNARMWEIFK